MEMVSEIKSPFTGGKVKEIATTEKQEFRKEIFTVHARYYVYEDTGEKFTTTNQHAIMFRDLYSQYRMMERDFAKCCRSMSFRRLCKGVSVDYVALGRP